MDLLPQASLGPFAKNNCGKLQNIHHYCSNAAIACNVCRTVADGIGVMAQLGFTPGAGYFLSHIRDL